MAESKWAGAAYMDSADAEQVARARPSDLPEPDEPETGAAPVDAAPTVEDTIECGVPERDDTAPATTAVVRSSSGLLPTRLRPEQRSATKGWRGAVRRASFGLVAPRAGEAEVAEIRDRRSVNAQWASPRTVVVANPKGGAGKTPTVVGLAATLGHARGGGTVAWDNNETLGTLGIRTVPQRFSTTAVDLLANLGRFERIDAKKGELSIKAG